MYPYCMKLSVLIPTYNYDCSRLVHQLQQQLPQDGEIIVGDDCSTDEEIIQRNNDVTSLPGCRIFRANQNLGRAAIRNALALDNDVIVVVDKEKLYQLEDSEDAPNHAVVVRGVQDENVSLFDPTLEDTDVKVSLSSFLDAWKESHNYMVRVLQSIEDYDPQPINLDDISLTDDLLELREAIAENAHEVWAAGRIKEGWTWGEERNDVERTHPCLMPYENLPESEKEYDRNSAFETLRLIIKLGFHIT